ncbi:diguanylate cyclase (GGDEF) domain-containing protein [Eubacterium ruminantium]|nr:diguanylate cyclase (GGDEF) domain-containing protein [Eubacterium ruminantium]
MRKIIALVVLRPQREYNLDIINRLKMELYDKGYGLLVFGSFTDLTVKDKNDYGERSVLELIPYDRLAGLIIMPGTFQDPSKAENIIENAKMRGIPTLSLDFDHPEIPSVNYDYKGGFGETVRHIVEFHKCKRIYMIAGFKDNPYSDERIAIYKEICAANGIPEENTRVYYGRFWGISAKYCIDDMIKSGVPLPDAICVANDVMAAAAIEQLGEYGIRVPEDVLVTGMDGIAIGKYNNPRLTTVETDSEAFCRVAAERILRMIEGRETNEPRLSRIPMRLCIHGSCGCNRDNISNLGNRMLELEESVTKLIGNEGHITRMKNMVLAMNGKAVFKSMITYLSDYTWIVVNPSFWENVQGTADDFDYEHDMNHFDENLVCEVYKPDSDGEAETRNSDEYDDKSEYGITFNRNELLPHFEEVFEKKGVIIVSPLNFQNEVIGYYAFCDTDNSSDTLRGGYYSSQIAQNVSTILRVVRDRDISDRLMDVLKNSYSALKELSIHDQLTGLLNRRGLTQVLDAMCEREDSDSCELFYSYIDVDGFKMINDMWGHDEGDEALKDVAHILEEVAERFGDLVSARIGGDEFVIAGSADDEQFPDRFMEVLQDAVDRKNIQSKKEYLIELSVGKVIKHGLTAEHVRESIKDADRDMYQVKKTRKQLKMK